MASSVAQEVAAPGEARAPAEEMVPEAMSPTGFRPIGFLPPGEIPPRAGQAAPPSGLSLIHI
eukprot:3681968-Prymnesium_polylepis.1